MKPHACSAQVESGHKPAPQRAFSLIELIGVLAIIAILAATLTPAVIRRMDLAAYNAEQATLASFTNALTLQMLLNKNIPGPATCFPALANWLSLPVASISTNKRGNTRAYLVDTSGWLTGSDYTQSTNGTTAATNTARVMFVSSIGKALPAGLLGTTPPSPADFANLWNAPPGTLPSGGVWNGWNGRPDDVVVQRMNLQPLFYQVILNNFETTPSAAKFTIDTNTTALLVPNDGNGWNRYYLDGTVLGLNSNATVQLRYVLKRNASFVFENGVWLSQILNGRPPTNGPIPLAVLFASNAISFFNAPLNTNAIADASGASQGVVLNAMGNFILDYSTWATMNFANSPASADQKKAKKNDMVNLITSDIQNLDNYSGNTKADKGLLDPSPVPPPPK